MLTCVHNLGTQTPKLCVWARGLHRGMWALRVLHVISARRSAWFVCVYCYSALSFIPVLYWTFLLYEKYLILTTVRELSLLPFFYVNSYVYVGFINVFM
jgi:hypothetical protein